MAHISPYTKRINGAISPSAFTHQHHIRAAWECLLDPSEQSIRAFACDLLALARRAGATGRYNATITGAFLTLIAAASKPGQSFAQFARQNPQLWQRSCLSTYYSP